MDKLPKHLKKRLKKPTTRSRSNKQEKKLASDLKGYATINSGATFHQNDVVTDHFSIEAKTTAKNSFSLKKSTWADTIKKCETGKVPLMQIDFEGEVPLELVVIEYQTLLDLLNGDL
jgi:hypothetical protein